MLPLDTTNKVLFLDNSAIELITTCPRHALYSILHQRRTSKPQPALRFGGHIHAALAYRNRCEALGKPWSESTQMRILDRRFTNTPCEDEEWRNLGTAQGVIQKYNLAYPFDALDIVKVDGFPCVEKPFAVFAGKVGEWQVFYTGRIDLAYLKSIRLWVRDYKTTSILGDSYWTDASMSAQQRGYCWALTQVLDYDIAGYEMNVLACRKPTKTGTAIELVRREYFVSPAMLEEWHKNMLQIATYFLWLLHRGEWPMHTKHCVHKYGTCEFLSVCSASQDQRAELLASSDYTTNTWTPLYT